MGGAFAMPLMRLAIGCLIAHLLVALCFVLDRAPGDAAALVGLPLDDAWIHLVYARSLAAFHGFAYNPGQLETGSTSPLWAVLLVPATWVARLFHVSVVVPAKLTCVLTAAAASLAAARLLRGFGFGVAVQLAVVLALACDPWLAFAQVAGMEVMLAGALGLFAVAELAQERHVRAGLAAGLAPLARPEMALLSLAVLAASEWRLHGRGSRVGLKLGVLLPSLVLLGGWMTYCWLVSGYPLPNTFYAKFASREAYLVHNLGLVVGQVLPASPWFALGAGLPLWALGGAVLWRRGVAGKLTAVFPVAFLVAVSASQLLREAEPFYYLRYLLPAQPFIVVALVVGASTAVGWVWQRWRGNLGPVLLAGTAAVLLIPLARLPRALVQRAELYAWNCRNIEEIDVAMALWLRDHVPADETIAVSDAGAARYFGEHRIFDILGLNHHGHLHGEAAARVELENLHVVSTFPHLLPRQMRDDPTWSLIHRVATDHLTICRCPQTEMVAYRRVGEAR